MDIDDRKGRFDFVGLFRARDFRVVEFSGSRCNEEGDFAIRGNRECDIGGIFREFSDCRFDFGVGIMPIVHGVGGFACEETVRAGFVQVELIDGFEGDFRVE